jgi:hypothetical protein
MEYRKAKHGGQLMITNGAERKELQKNYQE